MSEQIMDFDFPGNVVAFRCTGRVTKADYDRVLVPAVLRKLRRSLGERRNEITTNWVKRP